MNKSKDHLLEESRRILIVLKNDSFRLHKKLTDREREYIQILSMRRVRTHFPAIFKNMYDSITFDNLKNCSEDVINALDMYYSKVEEMNWFLCHTEDMPAMIEDRVENYLREITSLYHTLTLYLNAEIGVVEEDLSA